MHNYMQVTLSQTLILTLYTVKKKKSWATLKF